MLLSCSIQSAKTQNQNKAAGEKTSSLQRMRDLERSCSGWGLRTIKMIHLSKIKVSRTSSILNFNCLTRNFSLDSIDCIKGLYCKISNNYRLFASNTLIFNSVIAALSFFTHAVDGFHLVLLL